MLYILYPLKCIPGPCDVKMDRNKKKKILKKNTRDFLYDSVLQTQ